MRRLLPTTCLLVALGCCTAVAGDDGLDAALRRLLAAPADDDALSAVLDHPGFDASRIPELLHRAARFPAIEPGLEGLRVRVEGGAERELAVRVPGDYDPRRPWPLILAYHPSGGSGRAFIGAVEGWLGAAVEGFVVAAPTGYRQTGVDAPPPFTGEHGIYLDTLRRRYHVDGDRVYALGYSLGGYTAWALALQLPDRLAGAVALASTFTVPVGEDGLWAAFVENLRHVPVLHVWGERDRLPVPGIAGGIGSMAELNRTFRHRTRELSLPIRHVELPGRGHRDVTPPRDALLALLSGERAPMPSKVDHRFRHLHHGRAYWLRALRWEGEAWGETVPPVSRRPEGSRRRRLGMALIDRLGRLEGSIVENRIEVRTRHVAELEICLGRDQIDWEAPVVVVLDGRERRRAPLRPDPGLALRRAADTMELDRPVFVCMRFAATPTPAGAY